MCLTICLHLDFTYFGIFVVLHSYYALLSVVSCAIDDESHWVAYVPITCRMFHKFWKQVQQRFCCISFLAVFFGWSTASVLLTYQVLTDQVGSSKDVASSGACQFQRQGDASFSLEFFSDAIG